MATKKFDLMNELLNKGFERIDNPMAQFGATAEWYEKTWTKEVTYAWHRKPETATLRVIAKCLPKHNGDGYDMVVFEYSTGKVKDHDFNKRAWNALRDTVQYAGYEF